MAGQGDDDEIKSNNNPLTGSINREKADKIYAKIIRLGGEPNNSYDNILKHRNKYFFDELVRILLSNLLRAKRITHPGYGEDYFIDKEEYADRALTTAARLLYSTIYWAIMHEVGKALSGTPSAMFSYPADLTDDQIRARMRAASHEHEIAGASWSGDDPAVARRALAAVLERMLGFWGPARDLAEALRALEFGEVRPLLVPGGKGRHGPAYTLRALRLRALVYVEFRRGCGDSEEDARHEVAAAFGVSAEAVSTWRKRLPVKKDPAIQELLRIGRDSGERLRSLSTRAAPVPDPEDEELRSAILAGFGPEALARDGAEYGRALAAGRRSKPRRRGPDPRSGSK